MLAKTDSVDRLAIHTRLMAYSRGRVNDDALACILSSWQSGDSALPDWLGLQADHFSALLEFHFPGLPENTLQNPGHTADLQRIEERNELRELMLSNRAGISASEIWMADIVAIACQGQDHLWQDLGLWSRNELSVLMEKNFPALAARNDKDMKWKKFLYKQLCIAEGIYVCRSPSCEVCADYTVCFGPED